MPIAKTFPMDAYIQARRYQQEQNAQTPNWQTALAGIAGDYGNAYKQKKDMELKTAVEDRVMRQKTQSEALTKLFTDPNYEIKDDRGNIVPVDQRINIIPIVQQTGKMPAGFNVTLKPQRVYETDADKIAARIALGQDPRSLKQMEIDSRKFSTGRTGGNPGLTEKAIYENYNKMVDNEFQAKKHLDSLINSGLPTDSDGIRQAQIAFQNAQKDRWALYNKHKDVLSNTPQGQPTGTPQPTIPTQPNGRRVKGTDGRYYIIPEK